MKILVSKNKNRYVNEGFDLDLSYILPNVIAMGFPSQGIEGLYRNHMEDVQRFFNKKYYPNYKIYNLCSERKYDEQSFHCCSQNYTFDDHNPPIFMLMVDFCQDLHNFLTENPKNVAAVHCKAGKGRTGVMICCYLIYS